MIPTLRTTRLTLRPLRPGDAEAFATALDDWDVIRWLSGPPYPFRLPDARAFIAEARASEAPVWAITAPEGGLYGVIGLGDEFGYWLRRGAWGRGFATEAARAVLGWHFAAGGGALVSGIHPDNERSGHVLGKLGFRPAGERTTYFPSRGAEIERAMFRLDPTDWAALSDAPE